MVDTAAVRRHNLKRLVIEHGGMNTLARSLGLKKGAYISPMLSEKPIRSLSEKAARKWEKILSLPVGYFDTPTDAYGRPLGGKTGDINAGLLNDILSCVLELLERAGVRLSSAQLADLVTMQYADSVESGRADRARIEKIVGLLKR